MHCIASASSPHPAARPKSARKTKAQAKAAGHARASKSKAKAKPVLPTRANASSGGRRSPPPNTMQPSESSSLPAAAAEGGKEEAADIIRAAADGAAAPAAEIVEEPSQRPSLSAADDALAARIAADAVAVSDAARRKELEEQAQAQAQQQQRQTQRKQLEQEAKLERAKRIAAQRVAAMRARAEEEAKAMVDATVRAAVAQAAAAGAATAPLPKVAAAARSAGGAVAKKATTTKKVNGSKKKKAPSKAGAKTPAAKAQKSKAQTYPTSPTAKNKSQKDPTSPTAAIAPLDAAHPSPGTPLPPLPPTRDAAAEEKKQDSGPEEDDAVLNHALAAAAAMQTAGQSHQELTPAAALALESAAAAAEQLHGDDRMGDFHGAIGGERANPPAREAPKKRGLTATTGVKDAPPSSSAAKKTKPVRKKKGPGRPKKAPPADGSAPSDQKKETVTRTPRKGVKVTMKEGVVTLSSNQDTGGGDDMEFDEDDMEFDGADAVKPSGRKAAAAGKAPAKSNGGDKKRSASHSKSSTVDGDDDTDAEPPKKKGRGRPPKNKPEEESNTAKKTPAKTTPNAVHQADDTAAAAEARPSSTSRGRSGRTRGGGRPSSVAATAALAAARSKSTTKKKTQTQAEEREEKAHNLFISREGKNAFFRVELLIGPPGERVRMAPFSEVQREDGALSIDSYVATEGQPFALRIKIARPRSDNAAYGGRVYIDAPCKCKHHDTSERLGERHICGRQNAVVKQLNDGMDHFFWIGPGETEYIIEGFYKNQAESQQFVFAKPAQKLDLAAGVEGDDELQNERLMNIWRSIGGIRIAFSLLERWKHRGDDVSFKPKQAAIDADAFIERKGKELSAQPGDLVLDNVPETEREAVLSDEIVFEKRIDYNTFCGYKASQAMMKYTNTKTLYKGLPVDILKQEDVQRQCINMYMTQVPLEQMRNKFHDSLEDAFNKTHSEAGQSSSEGAAAVLPAAASASGQSSSKPGKWVRVTDIVDTICDDLSPAGSYLICTGQYHVDEETGIRNYGETIVQNSEATREERRADYEIKVKRLTHFFTKNPHVYDSQDYGADEETGRIRYEVCKAVVDLTANSDDEFADDQFG